MSLCLCLYFVLYLTKSTLSFLLPIIMFWWETDFQDHLSKYLTAVRSSLYYAVCDSTQSYYFVEKKVQSGLVKWPNMCDFGTFLWPNSRVNHKTLVISHISTDRDKIWCVKAPKVDVDSYQISSRLVEKPLSYEAFSFYYKIVILLHFIVKKKWLFWHIA